MIRTQKSECINGERDGYCSHLKCRGRVSTTAASSTPITHLEYVAIKRCISGRRHNRMSPTGTIEERQTCFRQKNT